MYATKTMPATMRQHGSDWPISHRVAAHDLPLLIDASARSSGCWMRSTATLVSSGATRRIHFSSLYTGL